MTDLTPATAAEHYAEAERLVHKGVDGEGSQFDEAYRALLVAAAQVHATLATAYEPRP